jgi:hypothetical protein
MGSFPVISYDGSIIIYPVVYQTQTNNGVSNNTTISIDNTHNLQRDLEMTLTLSESLSSIVISNLTNSHVLTISSSTGAIASGTELHIYKDSVYRVSGLTSVEASAAFSGGFFKLDEDSSNELKFNISPTSGKVDSIVGFKKPNTTSHAITYAQNFTFSDNRTLASKKNNVTDKYVTEYYTTDIIHDFSVDRLFFENYFLIDDDGLYQIKYDIDAEDVTSTTVYLCDAKINNITWSQSEGELVGEGVRGNFVRKIVG